VTRKKRFSKASSLSRNGMHCGSRRSRSHAILGKLFSSLGQQLCCCCPSEFTTPGIRLPTSRLSKHRRLKSVKTVTSDNRGTENRATRSVRWRKITIRVIIPRHQFNQEDLKACDGLTFSLSVFLQSF